MYAAGIRAQIEAAEKRGDKSSAEISRAFLPLFEWSDKSAAAWNALTPAQRELQVRAAHVKALFDKLVPGLQWAQQRDNATLMAFARWMAGEHPEKQRVFEATDEITRIHSLLRDCVGSRLKSVSSEGEPGPPRYPLTGLIVLALERRIGLMATLAQWGYAQEWQRQLARAGLCAAPRPVVRLVQASVTEIPRPTTRVPGPPTPNRLKLAAMLRAAVLPFAAARLTGRQITWKNRPGKPRTEIDCNMDTLLESFFSLPTSDRLRLHANKVTAPMVQRALSAGGFCLIQGAPTDSNAFDGELV